MQSRIRNFCFTINNPAYELQHLPGQPEYAARDIVIWNDKFLKSVSYMIYGKEVGDSGTPHLQGYCELKKQIRFNTLRKIFYAGAHIEQRKGTALQASEYCKKDGKFTTMGTISKPGKRSDLASVYDMVKEGQTDIQIGETHPAVYMKFYKAVDRVRFNYAKEDYEYSPVEVIVIVGEAGSGKSRQCRDADPRLYEVPDNECKWFDGYQGQKTILLDDYYGDCKYSKFLKLIDGYKYALPIKGGFTWKQWNTVYITSNVHPDKWYPDQGKIITPAVKRRISKIIEMGGGIVLPPTSETKILV